MTGRAFTDDEKFEALERELKMRERAYPRWVAEGRMTQKKADHEIAVMKAIRDDYRGIGKLL